MKNHVYGTAVVLSLVTACASNPPPPAAEVPSREPTTPEATVEVVATPQAPEPTPEQKAKAEAEQKLEQERAKMEADHRAELARWTPELRAEAKAVAEKPYAGARAALKAAIAGKYRKPANVARDPQRHPVETLEFLGFKPTLTVLEYGPGEGWYTEILAPALAAKGKLLITNGDPNGPADQRSTFYAQRVQKFLQTSPELYGKVETVTIDGASPSLPQDGTLDMVLAFRTMHGMVNAGQLEAWLAQFHKALKPKGVLGVEQHRAANDADPAVSAKQGYLPEKWLIEQIQAAGFKLAGKSELNANPKDTKNYPEGVWTLPPSLRLGDTDREKYTAIGESDRMTLKFVKVEKPKAKAEAAGPAAAAPVAPAEGSASAQAAPQKVRKAAPAPAAPAAE